MRLCFVVAMVFVLSTGPASVAQPLDPALYAPLEVAVHRPVPRRADGRRDGRAGPAERVLHRRQQRRRLEDDRLRPRVEADLRRPADRLDRRARRRPVEPERHLRRQRRRACSGRTSRPATASTSPTDGGKTWTHHRPARRPADRRRSSSTRTTRTASFVAVLGHPYGPNEERGVFRSTDGGKTLGEGALQGREHRRDRRRLRPGERATRSTPCCGRRGRARGRTAPCRARAAACSNRPTAARPGRSSRRGCRRRPTAWAASASTSRRAIRSACTPSSMRRGSGGLYRSDDAGETWRRVNGDAALWGRGSDFAEVKVDPKNPDIVYVANIAPVRRPTAARRSPLQGRARRRRLPHHLDQPATTRRSSCSPPTRAPSSR